MELEERCQDCKDYQERVAELEEELENLKGKFKEKKEGIESLFSDINEEKESLEDKLKEKEEKFRNIEKEFQKLKEDLEYKNNKYKQLKNFHKSSSTSVSSYSPFQNKDEDSIQYAIQQLSLIILSKVLNN